MTQHPKIQKYHKNYTFKTDTAHRSVAGEIIKYITVQIKKKI